MLQSQKVGLLESAQGLISDARRWNQHELLRAAEAGQLRNTGWPIGIVLRGHDSGPIATNDRIEARVSRRVSRDDSGWEDFWAFDKNGRYYVARALEEEYEQPAFQTSAGHPDRPLWFDVRIWRIAEIILHSAVLYKALDIPADEPYLLSVNHRGLAGREFWVSAAGRFVRRGRVSKADEATWRKQVTQDYVVTNLKPLVTEVSAGLFVLFDFMEVPETVVSEIVDGFLTSRL
jgi:hypothetical protein